MHEELHSNANEQNFWNWFEKNQDEYFHFEKNQNMLFTNLKLELDKVHPDLVFEFSPILEDGTREFVISADGIKTVFPIVINLVNKAPLFQKWKIVALRQPHKINQIKYGNLTIKLDDVYFKFGKDNGQIAIELNMRGFYESPEWTAATFILLDNIIGEYHAEMSLSRIEKKLLNESEVRNLYPITVLPKIIQDCQSEWNN